MDMQQANEAIKCEISNPDYWRNFSGHEWEQSVLKTWSQMGFPPVQFVRRVAADYSICNLYGVVPVQKVYAWHDISARDLSVHNLEHAK